MPLINKEIIPLGTHTHIHTHTLKRDNQEATIAAYFEQIFNYLYDDLNNHLIVPLFKL